jgi:hypothetical protein
MVLIVWTFLFEDKNLKTTFEDQKTKFTPVRIFEGRKKGFVRKWRVCKISLVSEKFFLLKNQ